MPFFYQPCGHTEGCHFDFKPATSQRYIRINIEHLIGNDLSLQPYLSTLDEIGMNLLFTVAGYDGCIHEHCNLQEYAEFWTAQCTKRGVSIPEELSPFDAIAGHSLYQIGQSLGKRDGYLVIAQQQFGFREVAVPDLDENTMANTGFGIPF